MLLKTKTLIQTVMFDSPRFTHKCQGRKVSDCPIGFLTETNPVHPRIDAKN